MRVVRFIYFRAISIELGFQEGHERKQAAETVPRQVSSNLFD